MRYVPVKLVLALGILFNNSAYAQEQVSTCPELVSLLVPQMIFHSNVNELPRVEVRKCGTAESLVLMGWARNSPKPDLVIDTTDFTIVQSVLLGRVTVIETTGGPRNRLFVIEYANGHPKLALKYVSKSQADISTLRGEIQISVKDSGTGQIKRFTFSTDDKSSTENVLGPGQQTK